MAGRVCLMGASLNTGNMGVTALGTSLVSLFQEVDPEAQIAAFIGERSSDPQKARINGRDVVVEVINYRLSPRGGFQTHLAGLFLMAFFYRMAPADLLRRMLLRWNPRLHALHRQDLVGHIWGGDSFSDLYGIARILVGTIACLTVHLLGKPLVLLPQTYGPYRSWVARWLAKLVLSRAKLILCRDPEGPKVLKTLLKEDADGKDIRFCPDVAFALETEMFDPVAVRPPLDPQNGRPLVGFNVSGLLYSGGYSRNNMFGLALDYREFVHKAARRVLEETDCALVLIPHTFAAADDAESDPYACRQVAESLADFPDRVHLLTGRHGPQAIKGIIGRCRFFVGSRMHACIAALSQGVPAVGVAYSDKFQGVFQSVGAGHMVIDARKTGLDEAVERVLDIFREAEEIRPVLRSHAEEARESLAKTFRLMLTGYGTCCQQTCKNGPLRTLKNDPPE